MRDIFRAYPNEYENVIGVLCENLDSLDNPEAKAAMIWIIGQYSGRIENAPELLENFLETFVDETVEVQMQLLTSIVMVCIIFCNFSIGEILRCVIIPTFLVVILFFDTKL